jgi:chromosome segregation ATPase
MAVMAREAWTDERLDDLNERVASIDRRMETGFAELRAELKESRAEMHAEFQAVRSEMHAEFQAVRAEMRSEFKAVRAEMHAGFQAVRTAMETGFKKAQAESTSIRRDMANQFAAQNRMMIQLCGGIFATMVVGFLGTIATIIAQT